MSNLTNLSNTDFSVFSSRPIYFQPVALGHMIRLAGPIKALHSVGHLRIGAVSVRQIIWNLLKIKNVSLGVVFLKPHNIKRYKKKTY